MAEYLDKAHLSYYTTKLVDKLRSIFVPQTRKVNNKALSSDIALDATDVLSSTQQTAVNSGITSTDVTKLSGIAAGAEVNVQANWNESDTTSDAYIQNKPTIPAAPVQSNWDEADNTSLAYIQNKPTIPDDKTLKGLQDAPFNVYLDSVNGDDTNSGDSSHPMKTIHGAIKKFANDKLYGEFRIAMKTGTYDFNVFNLSDINIHFWHDPNDATTGTTTINMTNPNSDRYDCAFYTAHFNYNGTADNPFTINFSNADGMYFDNCEAYMYNTTVNGHLQFNGGHLQASKCTLYDSTFNGANAVILECNLGFLDMICANVSTWKCVYLANVDASDYNPTEPDYLLHGVNSNYLLIGDTRIVYDGQPSITNYGDFKGCQVSLRAAMIVADGSTLVPFTGNLTFGGCAVMGTAARYAAFIQHATTVTVDTDCLQPPIPPAMTILSYGHSTWQDFINAYNTNTIVYCRASSNANPATGTQGRMAFMAYLNSDTNPTNVEFQYYRSVSTHSDSQQGDQVYVYKLDKTAGWTVTVRNTFTKIVAGTGLTSTWNNGVLTISLA